MAQENTHDAKMAACEQHKQAHIAYWKEHGNRPTDPQRFEDGFIQAWSDCENSQYPDINRDSMLCQRQDENVKAKGNSDCEWAFGDGYHEGFDARCEYHKQTFDTHPEKMKECEQHKQAHVKYWQEHGNRKTDTGRFEAGFIAGWCDAQNNRWPCITRDTLLCHRQDQNVQQCGQSDCEWAFGDGYHEGFDAGRCYQPPQQSQQPACPPAAPNTQPTQQPAQPPSQPPPPSTQPSVPVQPPAPVPQPPSNQPSQPVQPPSQSQPQPSSQPNQPPAPAPTQVPNESHTCNDQCNHAPDFCCTISCNHGPDHTCSDSCIHPQTRHCTKTCRHKILHRCTQNCSHELNDWCTIECSHGQHECNDACYHPTTRHCQSSCSHPKSHQCDNSKCDHVPNYYCTLECDHGRHECSDSCNHPKTKHCGDGCKHEGWMIMRQISAVQITEVITVTEVVQVEYVEVDESETVVEGKQKKEGFFHKLADAIHLDK